MSKIKLFEYTILLFTSKPVVSTCIFIFALKHTQKELLFIIRISSPQLGQIWNQANCAYFPMVIHK